jgi:T6SS immunity protein Tdi1, C-terminal
MNIHDYLIDHAGVDWPRVLSPWHWLLPETLTVWLMNRFGDLMLVFDDGTVHFFDVGAGTVEKIAELRDEFCDLIDRDDNANQWLMIPLIDRLVAAGMTIQSGYCYGYLQPPILGGDYTVANTVVLPIEQYFAGYAAIHEQIKDLPDGTEVRIKSHV